jgi:uncharacterized membrane protein
MLDKERLEAFSDGVLAVIITIMVLDLKVPAGNDFAALEPDIPTMFAYALSFVFVGIYWNNHHHLLKASRGIDGSVMWANMHLLFWLSFAPFMTGWIGEHPSDAVPTALYGVVLLGAALAYTLLAYRLARVSGPDSIVARESGLTTKQILSPALYAAGIACAFFAPYVADAFYVLVALMWFVPDRRLERALRRKNDEAKP